MSPRRPLRTAAELHEALADGERLELVAEPGRALSESEARHAFLLDQPIQLVQTGNVATA